MIPAVHRGWLGLALLLGLTQIFGCAHGSRVVARDLALNQQSLWSCRCAATAIATGYDAPGEQQRLWIAADNEVVEIRADGTATSVWAAPRFSRIVRLEPADLDDDGSDEWVVLLDTGRMRTRIVAQRDGVRVAVGKPWNGYLRPTRDREGSWVLFGQRAGGDRPFLGNVFRVDIDAGFRLKAGEAADLPRDLSLFDFFWVDDGHDKGARLFSLEPNALVVERNPDSSRQVLWASDARFVARPIAVEREYRGMLGDHYEGVVQFAPPAVVVQAGVGRSLIYITSQPPRGPVFIEGFQPPRGGDVRILEPGTRGLVELARTPLLGRSLAGITLWEPGVEQHVGVAIVWTKLEGGFLAPETRVLLFDPKTGDLVDSVPQPASRDEPVETEETEAGEASESEGSNVSTEPGDPIPDETGADVVRPAPEAE